MGLVTIDQIKQGLSRCANLIKKKQNTITGGASTITEDNLTASRALVSNSSGKVAVSAVTSTELGYLDGVTSAIQAQINGKAASSHGTHVTYSTTAPAAAGTASAGSAATVARSDHVHPAQTTVSGNAGTATKLAAARTIRTNLGSESATGFDGSANITPGVTGTLPVAHGGTGGTTAAAARTNLGAAEGYYKSATVSTAGWYRIATSAAGISNNIGVFSVKAAVNGKHSNVVLAAGISYGDNPDIVQILASNYSTASLTKVRLVYHGTYNNNYAYLEVYLNISASTTVDVNMALCEGWTLVAPNTAGSIPSGYTSKECVIANGGIGGYTASRALVTNSSGVVTESAVTSTELGYLDGVTSAIQTQLNGKAAASHGTHVSFSTTAPKAAGTAAVGTATTVARSDHVHPAQTTVSGNAGTATKLATARTIRTNLGSTSTASFDGSANITPGITGTLPVANGGTGATTAAAARTALGAAAKPAFSSVSLAVASWATNSDTDTKTDYPKKYALAISGATANDGAECIVVPASVDAAIDCGMCATVDVVDGYIYFYAKKAPAEAISVQIRLIK